RLDPTERAKCPGPAAQAVVLLELRRLPHGGSARIRQCRHQSLDTRRFEKIWLTERKERGKTIPREIGRLAPIVDEQAVLSLTAGQKRRVLPDPRSIGQVAGR